MTPDEVLLLQHVGQVNLMDLAVVISEAIFFGIYVILSTVAMFTLWNRGLKTKATLLPFLALNIVFIAYTLDFAGQIAVTAGLLRGALVDNPERPLRTRLNLANSAVNPWNNALLWLDGNNQGILFWMGDAVVVWRACVMFPHHTRIRRVLVCSLICGIVLAISSMVNEALRDSSQTLVSIDSPEFITQITGSVIFILVNSVFILFTTFSQHRKVLKAGLGRSQSKSVNVMILLVESGSIYCCVQISVIILSLLDSSVNSPEDWVFRIWEEFTLFASAIYPVAIILLVNHQHSIMDTPGLSEIISQAGANIQFANTPPVRNATDSLFIDTTRDETHEEGDPNAQSSEHGVNADLEKGERMVRSCP